MLLSWVVLLNCNSNSVFPMRLSPKSAMFILEPELIDLLCWLRIASSWFLFTNMYVSIMLLCINRLCIIGLCRCCSLSGVPSERIRLVQSGVVVGKTTCAGWVVWWNTFSLHGNSINMLRVFIWVMAMRDKCELQIKNILL